MDKPITIGDRLNEFFAFLGLNGKQVSEICDIPYPTLRKYLDDISVPGGDSLKKLVAALNLNVNWLLTGEGPMRLITEVPSGVAESSQIYLKDELLQKICQMVLKMDKEEQRELLKHCEDRELLAELRNARGKLKEGT